LDLLRVSGELAERESSDKVLESHVRRAQENIETDTMSECVQTLPRQGKMVLCAMLLVSSSGQKVFTSGSVINIYRELARELDIEPLTHRRVSDLINELNMLGIVTARVVSHGRHGRTTEIYFNSPTNQIRTVVMNDPSLRECSILQPLL
ncbi:MAG TPA: cell division control protein Cdc6, partial [Methanocorpusculum sp.]|nr:cell division control protein Cdc6 [Methanocorpusculum sp.]